MVFDPISVAGLALGTASVIIQILDGTLKCYEYFENAANMPVQYQSLQLRMQLEMGRLLNWKEAAGLDNEPYQFDQRIKNNGTIILAVLTEIKFLLKMMREMSLQYSTTLNVGANRVISKRQTQEPIQTQQITPATVQGFLESLDSHTDTSKRKKYSKGLNHVFRFAVGLKGLAGDVKAMSSRPLKTFKWVVMKDEEKFKECLQQLSQLNDYLHEILGEAKMNSLLDNTRDMCLAQLQLATDISQIRNLLEASKLATIRPSQDEDSVSIFSQAETLVGDRYPSHVAQSIQTSQFEIIPKATIFQRLAEFRALNKQVEDDGWINKNLNSTIDPTQLRTINTSDQNGRQLTTWNGKSIWIERKPYTSVIVRDQNDRPAYAISDRDKKNADRLIALLQAKKPAEFGVPYCHGYFDDSIIHFPGISKKNQIAFVYEIPQDEAADDLPKSLLELMAGDDVELPPLELRIRLAQSLAMSILYLHAMNWLHKSLRSACILFSGKDVRKMTRPYISGYEYSRPDINTHTGQKPPPTHEFQLYCHPDYNHRINLFRKSYDIYSLGIVLLEIAYWKPISVLLPQHGLVLPKDKTIRRISLKDILTSPSSDGGKPEILEKIKVMMGERYYNALCACIEGLKYFNLPVGIDETDPMAAALLQQGYIRFVVDVLHSIIV